jgi:hypothetical protein
MKMQGGGVGYYPRSGSPFVHTDTGNVRAWPRMSRQQLLALFPNGNTLHLPADGKPLPGYELAVARRKQAGSTTMLAYADTGPSEAEVTDRTGTEGGSSAGWLSRVFPGDSQEDADVAAATPAEDAAPAATAEPQQLVAAVDEDGTLAPLPRSRPTSELDASALTEGTILASTEADNSSTLPLPALPRSRPDNGVPARSAGALEADDASLRGGADDAIATLAARMAVDPAADDQSESTALAFAASEEALPSAADRAILTTFASIEESAAIRKADAVLIAGVIRRAAQKAPSTTQSQVFALASYEQSEASDAEPATLQPTRTGSVAAASGSGIVLAPDVVADYEDDETVLLDLIGKTVEAKAVEAKLAMPNPESELYKAPEAASEVAGLRGNAGPPADRYARKTETPSEEGFFSRLFASLIE